MKHQALARVFAVVLAVMCLLMLLNGATGFGKTETAQREREAFENKLAQRIENYRTLDGQIARSISYDEAYEQFKALSEQHAKDASQHRTDTALYTAEKGGNTMGANMIWEALPQVEGAKQELAEGKRKLEAMEAVYAENKGAIDGALQTAQTGEAACAAESARLDAVLAGLTPEPVIPDAKCPTGVRIYEERSFADACGFQAILEEMAARYAHGRINAAPRVALCEEVSVSREGNITTFCGDGMSFHMGGNLLFQKAVSLIREKPSSLPELFDALQISAFVGADMVEKFQLLYEKGYLRMVYG